MTMSPLAQGQEAVCQHHNDDVAMKAYPLPSLIVTQAQLVLGIFVEPVYVPTTMSILHKLL
jgi:hypothetical protein